MLASASVISINFVAALAISSGDSTRMLAANTRRDAASTNAVNRDERASIATIETRLLTTAARYVGTRYQLGGTKPGAFDCSGFVRYVFARHGIALPRTAREQAKTGNTIVVGLDSLQAGDLLFFRTARGRAGHVAIYVGEGRIIHASAGSRRVRYDDLASPRGRWFVERLTGIRRVAGIGHLESGIAN